MRCNKIPYIKLIRNNIPFCIDFTVSNSRRTNRFPVISKYKRDFNNFYRFFSFNFSKFVKNLKISDKILIQPIINKYGPTIDDDFDAIVVSPETVKTAEEINKFRKIKGKKPIKIVKIPFVLADNGKPISSTRIRNGEIDTEGCIITD